MIRILLLGGTTEASRMARLLADAGMDAVFSYAGRTHAPLAQPLPLRVGGFGGVPGLAAYLREQAISHVIDATHPFAAQMSRSAVVACEETRTPLLALERPAWSAGPGDRWTHAADPEGAARALPDAPARVFLAIGRQNLAPFATRPHHYLLRLVDPPEGPLPLQGAEAVIARGPFTAEGDEALMRAHGITHLVAKNSGGAGTEAKLVAARHLHLPVVMIDRPRLPPRLRVASPEEAMAWLHHVAPSARRGV
ncbi:cobalt-precorrin-6A reductase [Paracoccus alkanivorans]|uniref:Cobalt-precorrin-6A reductase n=1 Tax=Paracoccus alkanivorans TaxID=2116655 RepID=A0A3M0MG57_9RHOB|nr:cobalt-precorrin-6A reductase [Paracoccus alkanivorans]RMC35324.1 cobalt-precorrin-6A reductase [Paracoccus alkanivorans]